MNEKDNVTKAKAVDSLLNFETVSIYALLLFISVFIMVGNSGLDRSRVLFDSPVIEASCIIFNILYLLLNLGLFMTNSYNALFFIRAIL